jgi:hypothetical protein
VHRGQLFISIYVFVVSIEIIQHNMRIIIRCVVLVLAFVVQLGGKFSILITLID